MMVSPDVALDAHLVNDRLQLASRATNEVIRDWDIGADTVDWNVWLQATFGHSTADGQPSRIGWWADQIHSEDRAGVVKGLQDVLASSATGWSAVYRFRRADGRYAHVLDRSYVLRNDTGEAVRMVGSMLDITESKRAEAAAGELNRELELRVAGRTQELAAAVRELEAFSYSVSHDLRTPLRAIEGFSQAVLEDYGDRLDEVGRDYLTRIRAGSLRMAGLIDDMLRLSRVARAELRPEAVDLADLARSIVAELQSSSPRTVTVSVPDSLPARGDARLLRVALYNLLDNAWKFTRYAAEPAVEIGVMERDGEPMYFVKDNGAGFDMAHAGKLFGAFQRLHRNDEFEGTGIGLATVQRIIRRHGGRITAQAIPGEGATFYFTLSGDERT